jgi:hypothetical protein
MTGKYHCQMINDNLNKNNTNSEHPMPYQDLLSPAQRLEFLTLPSNLKDIAELYTLSAADQDLAAKRRTSSNRLGFAVQLCFLRFPGRVWSPEEGVPTAMLRFIAQQVGSNPSELSAYAKRDETRREHLGELLREYGWKAFTRRTYRDLLVWLADQFAPRIRNIDTGGEFSGSTVISAAACVRQAESARESGFGEMSAREQTTNPEFATSVNLRAKSADLKRILFQ